MNVQFSKSTLIAYSGFQMTVEKPRPKQLLRPITTGANSAMDQSQFLAIQRRWYLNGNFWVKGGTYILSVQSPQDD